MDFCHPVETVIPGVQGRILAVLAEMTAEINLRTIARLAGVSPAQATRVLPDLVRVGLVERREAPPSALFRMVDDHIAARAVRSLSRARDEVMDRLQELAQRMEPAPTSAVVFGSFARGEADATSDLDILLVRPAGLDADDEAWTAAVEEWRVAARRLTGNIVAVVEVDESELAGRFRRPTTLWAEILRDGVSIYGSPMSELESRNTRHRRDRR